MRILCGCCADFHPLQTENTNMLPKGLFWSEAAWWARAKNYPKRLRILCGCFADFQPLQSNPIQSIQPIQSRRSLLITVQCNRNQFSSTNSGFRELPDTEKNNGNHRSSPSSGSAERQMLRITIEVPLSNPSSGMGELPDAESNDDRNPSFDVAGLPDAANNNVTGSR